VSLGKICLPPGETKADPYFGRTEVYHHKARVVAHYAESASEGPLRLTVTYQGCAEAGLCYPPIVKHLTVKTGTALQALSAAKAPETCTGARM